MVDMFEIDRSRRRGGENRARFDFSTRFENSGGNDIDGLVSSWGGLKNRARFDVSRVHGPILEIFFFALFLRELGVFLPVNLHEI